MSKGSPEGNSMEQVRELLLGSMFKDMEQRVQRQEERLLKEISDLSDNYRNRLETLENFMKSENASLLRRLQEVQADHEAGLRKEQAERNENIAQLNKEIAQREESLSRRISGLAGTLDNVEQNLRKLFLDESSKLAEQICEKYRASLAALESEASQIRNDMVSRSALSGLLMEVAMKISGQGNDLSVNSIISLQEDSGFNDSEAIDTSDNSN